MRFQDNFLKEMNAKAISKMLALKRIIPEEVETDINQAKSKQHANIFLYQHLVEQGTVENVWQMCELARNENGYGNMNELGRRMLEEL